MKKVVLGEAKPSIIQPFFMDPIYFRIPLQKLCKEFIPLKAFLNTLFT